MIFSKLNGGDDLSAYPAAIQRALAYLRDTDIMSLELGRHELEAKVQEFAPGRFQS